MFDLLTRKQVLYLVNARHIEDRDEHKSEFGLKLSCFLRFWRQQTLPLKARVLLKDL